MLPNFFLAGVSKAGTTSLYHYLAQHPRIYMSPVKEPCYFAAEFRPENCAESVRPFVARAQRELERYLAGPRTEWRFGGIVERWEDYVRLFDGAAGRLAIGEATPEYLWSASAPEAIHARIPDAKFVVILRDPADRAFSQYLHIRSVTGLRRTFREQIEANLRNQSPRFSLDYPFLEFGNYYEQLSRYFRLFPRERFCVQLYEDFCADPPRIFRAVFQFLGVDASFTPDASRRHMEPRIPRIAVLGSLLRNERCLRTVRALTPGPLVRAARRLAFQPRDSITMSQADRQFLTDYYADGIRNLEGLIDKDLGAWLAYARPRAHA